MRIGILSEWLPEAHALHRAISLGTAHRIIWILESAAAVTALGGAEIPDLILMTMPRVRTDAGEVVRRMTASLQCPILIVTDSVQRDASTVFDAIASGAFDAIDLPQLISGDSDEMAAMLLGRIEIVARRARQKAVTAGDLAGARTASPDVLVAIGASAGGPAAIARILRELPADFPAGIVVVQHVDAEFAASMSAWLGEQARRDVRIAKEGDRPRAGQVLMAGGSAHLHVAATGRVGYTLEPRRASYRPSVDVFFHSASRGWPGSVVGVLLTGMGKDGAAGLKALRENGHHTIAQDQSSSVVYGMPKAAVSLNAAVDIRPLDRMADRLVDVVASLRPRPTA